MSITASIINDVRQGEYMPSPLPPTIAVKPATMPFGTAFEMLANNRKVRRLEWPATDYLFLRASFVHIHTSTGDHRLVVSDGDILATDWVEIETVN